MLMKSDLYWHVIPNPKSLQNPDSFLMTYERRRGNAVLLLLLLFLNCLYTYQLLLD